MARGICMECLQGISASQSLGFKDHILKSSHSQSATTLVSYCPSRSSEQKKQRQQNIGNDCQNHAVQRCTKWCAPGLVKFVPAVAYLLCLAPAWVLLNYVLPTILCTFVHRKFPYADEVKIKIVCGRGRGLKEPKTIVDVI